MSWQLGFHVSAACKSQIVVNPLSGLNVSNLIHLPDFKIFLQFSKQKM